MVIIHRQSKYKIYFRRFLQEIIIPSKIISTNWPITYKRNCLTPLLQNFLKSKEKKSTKIRGEKKNSHGGHKNHKFSLHTRLKAKISPAIWIWPLLLLERVLPRNNFIGYRRSSRENVSVWVAHRFMGPVFQSR